MQFGTPVGEPRGMGTHRGFRVPGTVWHCLALFGRLHLFMTGFMTVFYSVLLNYGPVLLNYGPVLLNYGPVLLNLGPVLLI